MKKNAKKKQAKVNAIVKINGKLDEMVLNAGVKQGQTIIVHQPALDGSGNPILSNGEPLFKKVQIRVISIIGPVEDEDEATEATAERDEDEGTEESATPHILKRWFSIYFMLLATMLVVLWIAFRSVGIAEAIVVSVFALPISLLIKRFVR